MLPDLDVTRPGKFSYDLGPLVGTLDGVAGDSICCINNGEGASVLLCGGIHGDEYEAQIVLRRLADRLEHADVTGRVIIVPPSTSPRPRRASASPPSTGRT